jgi:hypothetical protein
MVAARLVLEQPGSVTLLLKTFALKPARIYFFFCLLRATFPAQIIFLDFITVMV